MFIRLSILHLYIVIFQSPWFRRYIYVIIGLVIAVGLVGILGVLLQCQPFAFAWDKTIPGGHCLAALTGFRISAVLNMVMDIVVFVSPIKVVWSLQMNRRKKIAVTVVFGLGFM